MGGMGSLRLFTYTTNGEPERQTEKFVSLTTPEHGRERWWVNTVVYPGHPSENSEPVAIQTTIGCNIGCQMCSNPRNQKGLDGVTIPYVRPLSTEEMLAQVYLATNSPRIRRLFRNDVDTGLLVNFTGPGDGLANNLKNCAAVIEHLSKIEKPAVSFVITSVGREDRLKEYLNRYIDLPRVTQYWSVNSLNNQVRSTLMPGTRGQNLENLRGLYQKIAEKTGRPVTASFALFKGLNDGWDDVERITAFFQGKPFRIKLMAGCPRSMPDIPDITGAEVEAFRDKLVYLGLPPEMVRVRTIYGIDVGEYSGCGNTQPDFLVGDLSESS
jgi:adenine C2-methylase RlmN of 23S rRNA A2503 and tRNA A37